MTKSQNSLLQLVGTTALIVGLGLLAIALINRHTLQKYRDEGITVEARITHEDDNEACIGVSFFDKSLFEGGELYLTEICDFVTEDIRRSTREGGHELVVFLPEDPANHVIFWVSLENKQLPTLTLGVVLFVLGLFATAWHSIATKRSR